jgi:hypothetical protein
MIEEEEGEEDDDDVEGGGGRRCGGMYSSRTSRRRLRRWKSNSLTWSLVLKWDIVVLPVLLLLSAGGREGARWFSMVRVFPPGAAVMSRIVSFG